LPLLLPLPMLLQLLSLLLLPFYCRSGLWHAHSWLSHRISCVAAAGGCWHLCCAALLCCGGCTWEARMQRVSP